MASEDFSGSSGNFGIVLLELLEGLVQVEIVVCSPKEVIRKKPGLQIGKEDEVRHLLDLEGRILVSE